MPAIPFAFRNRPRSGLSRCFAIVSPEIFPKLAPIVIERLRKSKHNLIACYTLADHPKARAPMYPGLMFSVPGAELGNCYQLRR